MVILMAALTKRIVDSARPKPADYFLWCSSVPGFGARVYPSGKRVFVCRVRVGRATRRIKIGVFGAYTVEQARQRAREIIRAAGAAQANLVTTRFRRPKRDATLKIDEGRFARHIKPLIGLGT